MKLGFRSVTLNRHSTLIAKITDLKCEYDELRIRVWTHMN